MSSDSIALASAIPSFATSWLTVISRYGVHTDFD